MLASSMQLLLTEEAFEVDIKKSYMQLLWKQLKLGILRKYLKTKLMRTLLKLIMLEDATIRDIEKIVMEIPVHVKHTVKPEDIDESFVDVDVENADNEHGIKFCSIVCVDIILISVIFKCLLRELFINCILNIH